MLSKKLVEKRKSVREYSNKGLGAADKAFIRESLEKVPTLGDKDAIKCEFYEDGADFIQKLSGLIGYNGVIIESPHYLVLSAKKGLQNFKSAGFASEWFVLALAEREIGTCQVSTDGNEDKIAEKLEMSDEYIPACVLAVGHPKKESFLASIFGSSKQTARQSVEQEAGYNMEDRAGAESFVFVNEFGNGADLGENEDIGFRQAFYYMRLAPSVLNRQPWKFVLSGGKVVLFIDKGDDRITENTAYIEAGIAMFYFAVAMEAESYYGDWDLSEDIDRLGAPDNYIVAGTYLPKV